MESISRDHQSQGWSSIWISDFSSVRQTEPKSETASVCRNRADIGGKPKTFFFYLKQGNVIVVKVSFVFPFGFPCRRLWVRFLVNTVYYESRNRELKTRPISCLYMSVGTMKD
jgi:hypothetical protein